jgi:hypothetical protein
VGFCGGLWLHVFYIPAHPQYETHSSCGNMKRQVMEAKVKGVTGVTGVTGPEGMPLLKYLLNSLLFRPY